MTTDTDINQLDRKVLLLDPNEVQVHPSNARKVLRDIPALADSIRQVGVLAPVLVVELPGGGHQLIIGHRRRAAAIEAQVSLPALVVPAGDVQNVLSMLAENESRDDLTTAERARIYQAAFDLGLGVEEVALATGRPVQETEQVTTVANSVLALGVTERHDLSLEHALVLAEFDADKEAMKRLTAVAIKDPRMWEHRVERERRDRDARLALKTKLEEYQSTGVKILKKVDEGAKPVVRQRIDVLADDKGKDLTPARHAKCPGRSAAVVDNYGNHYVAEFCENPKVHGHQLRARAQRRVAAGRGAPAKAEAERKKESDERKEVIANNKAMDAANAVRRTFVKALLARRIPAKTNVAAYVAQEVLHRPGNLDHVQTDVWAELTGQAAERVEWSHLPTPAPAVLKACRTDAEYLRAMLGLVCAAWETLTNKEAWRHADTGRAAYLGFLESAGYALSDVERLVLRRAAEEALARQSRRRATTPKP